ncbi:Unknown protein, partial [Striga hermonthica]
SISSPHRSSRGLGVRPESTPSPTTRPLAMRVPCPECFRYPMCLSLLYVIPVLPIPLFLL